MRSKTPALVITVFVFLMTGCIGPAVPAPASPSTVLNPATEGLASMTVQATIAASQTPTQLSTLSPSLTPTATPDLNWVLQAPLAEVEYRLPLTVRHLTETTAILQFALEEPSSARVITWRQSDRGDIREHQFNQGHGVVTLDGLTPGTQYQAAVLVEGDELSRPTNLGGAWPNLNFHTMDYSNEPLQVAVLGDSGFGGQVTRGIAQQIAAEGVDLVLHTGDVVYRIQDDPDPPSAYKLKLFQTHQPILVNFPFYPVPGNHEYDVPARWQGDPYYLHAFPTIEGEAINYPPASDGSWYAFVQNNIQFLMLNTQSLFGQVGDMEQRQWLSERIADPEVKYSVVVLHVPPYSLGRHQNSSAIVRSRWGNLLINERVPLIIAGHDHNYQRWQVGPTAVVVSGGGSAVLYDLSGGDPSYQAGARSSHHVLLDLAQGGIGLSAIDKEGTVIDQARLETP